MGICICLSGMKPVTNNSILKMTPLLLHFIFQISTFYEDFFYIFFFNPSLFSYIKSQKKFLTHGRNHPREVVEHPVDAYLLVRRLTADWEDVQMSLHAISNYSTGNIENNNKTNNGMMIIYPKYYQTCHQAIIYEKWGMIHTHTHSTWKIKNVM